ncbi:MAG: hypothetical protein GXP62_17780, partial [Oligoflexia bacterium]|nr:hypothetical protein [Oligoflexia bacterium]
MGLLRSLSSAHWDPSTDPAVTLERARALLAADLWRLDLPSPSVTINDLDLTPAGGASPALDPMPIDRVFCAQVRAPELVLSLCLPLSGCVVLPAEMVGRVRLPAPATALLRPTGWEPHPDQADDPVACAFIDALNARPDLALPLQWGPADQQGPDWAIQLIADAGDSCLLVVRTAPLGDRGQYAGLEAFLDILPLLRDLIRAWPLQFALPAGVAADCVALRELPQGEVWLPDWSYEEPRLFTPDSLEEGDPAGDPNADPEEDPDDVPTELAYTPRVLNLAEVEFSEPEEAVLLDEEPTALTYDGPVVEIDDDDGYEDDFEEDEVEVPVEVPVEVEAQAPAS